MYILLTSQWHFLKNRSYLKKKESLSKYKKTDITPCMLPVHNSLQLELNDKNNRRKYANNWRMNNTLLNDQWVKEEIREEIKSFLEVNENENTTSHNL
jgi:hypothetical protein